MNRYKRMAAVPVAKVSLAMTATLAVIAPATDAHAQTVPDAKPTSDVVEPPPAVTQLDAPGLVDDANPANAISQPNASATQAGMPLHSNVYFHLGVGAGLPLGDSVFGLQPFNANASEFSATPNVGFALGYMPPGRMVNLGLHFDFGFGPLNSDDWTKALGVEVGNSVLFDVAVFAEYRHEMQRYTFVVGADGGFVSLGTATDSADENIDQDSFIDHRVSYSGASGAAYVGLHRGFDGSANSPAHFFVQLRAAYRSWRSLKAEGPTRMPALRDDVEGLKLNHISLIVGISGFTAVSSKRNRAFD